MSEEKKENRGGARPGAGRKSVKKMFHELSLTKKRKMVMSYISDEDVKRIVRKMVKRAEEDSTDAKYLLDQFIGKSLQATDITSGGEKIESFNDEQVDRIAARIAKRRASNGSS
jgi:hypothetical protein